MSYESIKYYLQDARTYVGNSVMWHCHHGKGYTCDIRKAGVFSGEEVSEYIKTDTDIPWEIERVNRVIQFHIDIQDLRKSEPWRAMPHTMENWGLNK